MNCFVAVVLLKVLVFRVCIFFYFCKYSKTYNQRFWSWSQKKVMALGVCPQKGWCMLAVSILKIEVWLLLRWIPYNHIVVNSTKKWVYQISLWVRKKCHHLSPCSEYLRTLFGFFAVLDKTKPFLDWHNHYQSIIILFYPSCWI